MFLSEGVNTHLILFLKPCPQGYHAKVHGEGAGQEGWGSNVHATAANQKEESEPANLGTILCKNGSVDVRRDK